MTSWTAPAVTRTNEPMTGAERPMLEGWLDWHRQTLLMKAAGLTAEQLKLASVEPSNLTLLGLIRHMTEVERSWFRTRAAGDAEAGLIYCSDDNVDGDFDDVADADAEPTTPRSWPSWIWSARRSPTCRSSMSSPPPGDHA
jgi:hypothetical protein